MPPPSQLSIATSALARLVKEERSYHKELEQQQSRVEKLEKGGGESGDNDEEGNAEFILAQEKKAIEETKAVFPSLRQRIKDALGTLEEQLELAKEEGSGATVEQITKAKETVSDARTAQREIS